MDTALQSSMGRYMDEVVLFASSAGMELCNNFNPSLQIICKESADLHPTFADVLLYLQANRFTAGDLIALVDDAAVVQGPTALEAVRTDFAAVPSFAKEHGLVVGNEGYAVKHTASDIRAASRLSHSVTVSAPYMTQAGSILRMPFDLSAVTQPSLFAVVANVPALGSSLSPMSTLVGASGHDVVKDLLWTRLLTSARQNIICTTQGQERDACHPIVILLDHTKSYSAFEQASQLKSLFKAFLAQHEYRVVVVSTSRENELSGEDNCAKVFDSLGAGDLAKAICEANSNVRYDGIEEQAVYYFHVPSSKSAICEVLAAISGDAIVHTRHKQSSELSLLPSLQTCTPYAVIEIPHDEVEHVLWMPTLPYNAIRSEYYCSALAANRVHTTNHACNVCVFVT